MSCKFTVFTPTFNRAHTLGRLWESLAAQAFDDFEWLVVDDGSTDDTAVLVETFRSKSRFDIRYMYQENSGKHVAFNRAVDLARGELFLPVDSDDALVPHALVRFSELWRQIPAEYISAFSGVTAACQSPDGRSIGQPLPKSILDCNALDAVFRWRVTGERFGFQRTSVLRQIRFPVGDEMRFVPEGVLWNAIARQYVTRFVNDPLRIYFTDEQSRLSTSTLAIRGAGLAYWSADLLSNYTDYALRSPLAFLKAAVHYLRFKRHVPPNVLRRHRLAIGAWPFLLVAALPAMTLRLTEGLRRSS